jgi:N-acetylmuramoyl-L-alanine amidase
MPTIVLDAGHTGKYWNRGAVTGYYESAVMWEYHKELGAALEKKGFKVKYTRSTIDTEMDVTVRGKKAKGTDLLLSCHSNSTDNNTTRRAVAIYQTADSQGVWDTESKAIANKLAAVIADVMGVTWNTYSKLSSNDRDGDGKKDDNYYGVLHGARLQKVPAVILEHSFHSNPETCRWLMNVDNRLKMANAVAEVLADHYGLTVEKLPTKEEPKKTETFKAYTATIKPLNGLNVRSGAGTKYKKLGALKYKTKITILEEKSGWGRIVYKDKTGWVSLQYVKKK